MDTPRDLASTPPVTPVLGRVEAYDRVTRQRMEIKLEVVDDTEDAAEIVEGEIDDGPLEAIGEDNDEEPAANLDLNAQIHNLFSAENSPLAQVAAYYLSPLNLPSFREELKKQLFLFIVAISGCAVYGLPADKYAEDEYDSSLIFRVLFIICTCLPALGVLYTATDTFLEQRKNEREIPFELNEVLASPLTPLQQKMKDAGIFIGAAFSAVPFTALSLVYPLPFLPIELSRIQSAIVGFDNTILHFLPVNLAFQNRWYRFPIYIFEKIYDEIKHFRMTQAERTAEENQQKMAEITGKIKQAMAGVLNRAQNNLALHGMRFNSRKLVYQQALPQDIVSLLSVESPPLNKLLALARYYPSSQTAPADNHTRQKIDKVMMPLIYAIGALWVTASCAGYIAAPINEMSKVLDSILWGTLLTLPPSYFFMVLLAWIGGNTLQGVYQYLTHWGENDVKLPVEFKIYPKTFGLLTLLNGFFASFSYGAANQTILDNFYGELEPLVQPLLILSETGISFIGFYGLFNVYSILLNKFAQHFGADDAQQMVQLKNMINHFQNGLSLIKANELIESLGQMSAPDLMALTGLTKTQFSDLRSRFKQAQERQVSEPDLAVVDVSMGGSDLGMVRSHSLNIESAPRSQKKSYFGTLVSFFQRPAADESNQTNFFPMPSPPRDSRSINEPSMSALGLR